jgi:hypothetical protein
MNKILQIVDYIAITTLLGGMLVLMLLVGVAPDILNNITNSGMLWHTIEIIGITLAATIVIIGCIAAKEFGEEWRKPVIDP